MGRKSLPSQIAREMANNRDTMSGGHNGGRPRSKGPRCPCRAMTLKRAIARAHHCAAN